MRGITIATVSDGGSEDCRLLGVVLREPKEVVLSDPTFLGQVGGGTEEKENLGSVLRLKEDSLQPTGIC